MKRTQIRRLIPALIFLLTALPLWADGPYLNIRSSYHDGASKVSSAYRESYNANLAMTVEAWVRRDHSSGFETIISQGYSDSFWFGFAGGNLRFHRSGGTFANSAGIVPANQWTHVAASYDGTRVRFYIDGVASGAPTLSHAGTGTTEAVFLGSDRGTSRFFKGNLDEVRLWTSARTATEIAATMFSEEGTLIGLGGSWPKGGVFDRRNFVYGLSEGSPLRSDREGIIPTDLVVPTAATTPVFDGNVNTSTEYARAESAVLRYRDGPNFHDAIAYLVHTDDYLYIGVERARLPTGGAPSLDNVVRIYVDSDRQTPEFNPELWRAGIFLNDGLTHVSQVETTTFGGPFPITTNSWKDKSPSPSTIEIKQGNERENEITAALDFELRIHRSVLGVFDGTAQDRLAISHTDNGGPTGDRWMPEGGIPDDPTTWIQLCYSSKTTALPEVTGQVRVLDDLTGEQLPGVQVSLDGNGVTYETITTSAGEWSTFQATVGYLEQLQYRLTLPEDVRSAGASAGISHFQPNLISHTEVRFDGCDSDCQLADITFRVTLPPPPTALTNFEPAEVWPETLLRSGPDPKSVSASIVTVTGENLHRSLDFFFVKASCPDNLVNCTEGIDYFAADSSYHISDGSNPAFYEVTVPQIPSTNFGNMRLTAHDLWARPANNPGHIQSWRNFPDLIAVGPPPYPLIHGFAFANEGDGHDIDDYRAAFYDQVCDPRYMVGFWAFFPIYLDMLEGGECVGMTATAQQFSKGRATGPLESGVLFGNGFRTGDGVMSAPKPATFNVSNPCSPDPTNVWAAVRANHGVQMSSEFIGELLGQFDFDPLGINLGNQLDKIRANPTDWMICLRYGDKGHCVQPLRVIDVVRDDAGNILPRHHQIEIWDCNFPNQTRVIDIDLDTERYTYDGDFSGESTWIGNWLMVYEIAPIYNNQRHVPSIDTLAFSLGQFGVTHLWEFLQLIVSGDAEPMIRAGDGSEVGWNATGKFIETGSETYPIPAFNWLTTDVEHHPVSMHHRLTRGTPEIDLHNRGNSYKIHASHHGTIFQFFVNDGEDKTTDDLNCESSKDRILGLRFQTAVKSRPRKVTSRIALCRNTTDYPLAVTVGEVAVPSGEAIVLTTDPDGTGLIFDNDTSAAMTPGFTFTSVNPKGDDPLIDKVPALPLPAGGRFAISSPDGVDFRNLLISTDHDRDGLPERTLQYLADEGHFVPYHKGPLPALSISRSANGDLVLSHPQNLSDACIEFNFGLEGKWSELNRADYPVETSDGQFHLNLGKWKNPTSFFRLNFSPVQN